MLSLRLCRSALFPSNGQVNITTFKTSCVL
uniref:Uncharacterized protein n=1 Tax=Lepeophtheirus salmonis TaxID=72036 RepID=A0A0K2T014_LEPSM